MRQHTQSGERHVRNAGAGKLTRLTQELAVTREYLQSVIGHQQDVNEELRTIYEELQAAREETYASHEMLTRVNEQLAADLAAMTRLQEVGNRLVQASNLEAFLDEILDAAIAITSADMGNIQLRERGSTALRIVANRGFDRAFLEFFSSVYDGDAAACATSMHRGKRVVIEDVTKSEIFAGTPARDVRLAAGVRGVQSTPLISRSGTFLGMFSTHYRSSRRPADRDLALLDLLARQAADGIERIQIEEARLEAANRSQQLLDVTSAGVYAVDARGVITYCNQQAVHFWGRTPGPGDTYEQFWPPARRITTSDPSRPPDVMPVRNALHKGDSIRGEEATIERPDGSRIPVQVNVDPIRDGDGRIAGAITVFYDVTHLKRALTADRLKDQFVAMLAHELRNPLAALALTVELMRRDREAGIAADDVGVLDRQVANLARLVDDLLDVTRMRLGKIRLLKTPIDLRAVVTSAVASVTPGLEAKGRSLSVDRSSEPVFVEGDGDRLGQALTNLLDNAIKYTDAGGHAGIALAADVQTAVLRVSDTGIGIKPEMLPHVFELFAQEEGSFARSRGGLGIGLFVVARLAEMHGGTVEAHSEGPGKGAEFIVRLPRLSQSQVDGLRAGQTTSKATPTVPALHILVVEDNADVADKLAALLRRDGHEVRLAYDGSVGVAAASAFPPELVLLDIALPGMDGYEVARHIRQQSGLENVKIVGLSGYTHEDARRRALDAGFDELLAKPVDLKALEATLARLVPSNDSGSTRSR